MTAKSMGVFFKMRIIKPYYGYMKRILAQEITVYIFYATKTQYIFVIHLNLKIMSDKSLIVFLEMII